MAGLPALALPFGLAEGLPLGVQLLGPPGADFALLRLAADPPQGHAQWQALMHAPAVALATGLAFGALLLHAWVGARDVLMDYVKPLPLRIGLMTLLVLLLGGSGITVLRALL